MKLSEILKQKGMFSQDIKIRLKNKQMSLDGEVLTEDIEMDVKVNEQGNITMIDSGEFIFDNIAGNNHRAALTEIVGFENLSSCNITNEFTSFMKGFHILRVSKKEVMIIEK